MKGLKASLRAGKKTVGALKPPEPKPESEIISQWGGDYNEPLISIQCLTYNHAPYIEDAIHGFLMQITDFPFEIWIHDDASTDGTRAIIEHYQAEYPRIIKSILQSENQYSKGLKPKYFLRGVCKGKYIALCEGDDFWLSPNKLSCQIEAIRKYPDAYICIHPAFMYDMAMNTVTEKFEHGENEQLIDVNSAASSLFQYAPTSSYLFTSKEYEAMPDWFFEARDLPFGDYFIEVMLGRNGLVYMPDYFSVYRRNVPGSYSVRTNQASEKLLLERLQSVIKYTNKINSIDQISTDSVVSRRKKVFQNYLDMAVDRNSFDMYSAVMLLAIGGVSPVGFYKKMVGRNKFLFNIYVVVDRLLSSVKRQVRRAVDKLLKVCVAR